MRLFAAARQSLGRDVLELDVADGTTIGTLRSQLMQQYPELAELAKRSMFAIDTCYGRDDQQLTDQAVVAWIPPVSGG